MTKLSTLLFKIVNKLLNGFYKLAGFIILIIVFVVINHARAEVVEVIGFNGKVIKVVECNDNGQCFRVN